MLFRASSYGGSAITGTGRRRRRPTHLRQAVEQLDERVINIVNAYKPQGLNP